MIIELDRLHKDAASLNRTLHRRNLREVFAGALVATLFGIGAFLATDTLVVVGASLVSAGALVVSVMVYVRGVAPPVFASNSSRGYLAQYRSELEHQARLLKWVPAWYIGPLLPGVILCEVALYVSSGLPGWVIALHYLFAAALLVGVVVLNLRASRQLQQQANALPRWEAQKTGG